MLSSGAILISRSVIGLTILSLIGSLSWVAIERGWTSNLLSSGLGSSLLGGMSAESPSRQLPAINYGLGAAEEVEFLSYDIYGNPTGLWDPCREIRYAINPKHEPPGARELVHEAFATVESLSGLKFTFVGETLQQPVSPREPVVDDEYSPILVGYLPDKEFLSLANELGYLDKAVGLGGPDLEWVDIELQQSVAVSGIVYLSSTWVNEQLLMANQTYSGVSDLLMHEIGHLIGLGHFDDEYSIMYEFMENGGLTNTDRAAFSAAGNGSCFADSFYPYRFNDSDEVATNPDREPKATFEGSIGSLLMAVDNSIDRLENDVVMQYPENGWVFIIAPGYVDEYYAAVFENPNSDANIQTSLNNDPLRDLQRLTEKENVSITPTEFGFELRYAGLPSLYAEVQRELISRIVYLDSGFQIDLSYEASEPYLSKLREASERLINGFSR